MRGIVLNSYLDPIAKIWGSPQPNFTSRPIKQEEDVPAPDKKTMGSKAGKKR